MSLRLHLNYHLHNQYKNHYENDGKTPKTLAILQPN